MKLSRIAATMLFAALVIGVPSAYLAGALPTSSAELTVPKGAATGVSAYDYRYCSSVDNPSCYERTPQRPTPQYGTGVERFLLIGPTNPSDPGNATTSFLMAFFGIAAGIAGATLLIERRKPILRVALMSSGLSLFVAAQILWSGGDNGEWLAGLALLAINVSALAGLGFLIFKTAAERKALVKTIVGGVLVATVMIQSGVFYDLIGTPDYRYGYDNCPACAQIQPLEG